MVKQSQIHSAAAGGPLPAAPAWLSARQQPPAAIRYSDGQPVPHPGAFFATKAAGQQAVARYPSMDLALHAGSVTLRFAVSPGAAAGIGRFYQDTFGTVTTLDVRNGRPTCVVPIGCALAPRALPLLPYAHLHTPPHPPPLTPPRLPPPPRGGLSVRGR